MQAACCGYCLDFPGCRKYSAPTQDLTFFRSLSSIKRLVNGCQATGAPQYVRHYCRRMWHLVETALAAAPIYDIKTSYDSRTRRIIAVMAGIGYSRHSFFRFRVSKFLENVIKCYL